MNGWIQVKMVWELVINNLMGVTPYINAKKFNNMPMQGYCKIYTYIIILFSFLCTKQWS